MELEIKLNHSVLPGEITAVHSPGSTGAPDWPIKLLIAFGQATSFRCGLAADSSYRKLRPTWFITQAEGGTISCRFAWICGLVTGFNRPAALVRYAPTDVDSVKATI